MGSHSLLQGIFLTQESNAGLFHCRQNSLQSETSGKPLLKNTAVGCRALLQGIFLTRGSNPCLLGHLHWQVDSLPVVPLIWEALMCLGIIFKINILSLHLDILPIILQLIILS